MRQRPPGRQLRRLTFACRHRAARCLRRGANRLIIVFFGKVILLMTVGFCLGGVKGRTYAVNTTKEKPRHASGVLYGALRLARHAVTEASCRIAPSVRAASISVSP